MTLTFLGTSHGLPEPNQRCTSIMIEVSGRYYFIDMGVQVMEDLATRGISPDDVKGVFITHMHGDHADGLINFVDLLSWYYKNAQPEIFLPKIEGTDAIRSWLSVSGVTMRELPFREVHAGPLFDDGYLKVTAIPTQHCPKSHAYLVEAEGKTVLFTGDLKHPTVDFPEIAKTVPTDLMVCESVHFPATAYTDILRQCPTKRVCFHHYRTSYSMPYLLQTMEDLKPLPTFLATDGLIVNL